MSRYLLKDDNPHLCQVSLERCLPHSYSKSWDFQGCYGLGADMPTHPKGNGNTLDLREPLLKIPT